MSETQLDVQTEAVEDIPVLIAKLKRMRILELAERHYVAHGNWQGCSVGQMIIVWLTYILSEGDHRLSHVQEWVQAREKTLSACLNTHIRAEDFSDDRLGIILDMFGVDESWQLFDCDMTQGILRVYDLKGNLVRLDSTSGSGWKMACSSLDTAKTIVQICRNSKSCLPRSTRLGWRWAYRCHPVRKRTTHCTFRR